MMNDANCFALGEASRLKKSNLVALTLGTGIGGGIVINKQIYIGKGNAGELGHCTIKYDGPRGMNQGDLESFLGARAITKRYRVAPNKLEHWNDFGRLLGIGIANIANAFDPDVVVLGGGVTESYRKFKRSMMQEINKRAVNKVKVVKGKKESAILGAASIV
jgi:glucokinase